MEATIRRVLALSRADQLRLFAALREYLGEAVGKETEADRQITRQAAALAAIRAVAEHLHRTPGEPMTTGEFNDGAREIGSEWNSSRVIRAWGSWRQAMNAYRGAWVRESPAQRALRRATSGRSRGAEDYATGLRDWLATRPASTTRHDYDDWVSEENERRPAGELPYVKSSAIVGNSALLWGDWLAIARGESSYEERAGERLKARTDPSARHDLISSTDVALLLGIGETSVTILAQRPAFPRAVARIGQARVWYRSDVEAYRDGRPVPERREGELQDELIAIPEIAERLGISASTVRTHLSEGRYHLAPPPSGRAGDNNYWYRNEVEEWISRLPGGRRGRSRRRGVR